MRDFELQFSDKLITLWGGMALIKRMLDHIGFDRALDKRRFEDRPVTAHM